MIAQLQRAVLASERNEFQNLASNKTLIDSLPYPAEGVEVVYTVDPVEAQVWLTNNIIDCSAEAVGFDIEWKPQFVSKKNGGVENKTAVLQLGVESSCLVLHLHNMKDPPNLLSSILNDEKILKIGSGILQDFKKLKRDKGLTCKGLVDTQKMAKCMGTKAPRQLGLKALAKHFLGMNMEKPVSIARSNWEQYPLTIRQIHYAALDAWIGFRLYQHMKLMKGQGQTHVEETQLVGDEVDENPLKIVVCHVCKKKCKGNDALARHIKIHPQCKCGKLFQATVSKNHKKTCPEFNAVTLKHDDKVDENPVEIVACHVCKKKCKGNAALATHIKIHAQCKCGKFFQAKVSKNHKKNCTKVSPASVNHIDDKVDENPLKIVVCRVCKKKCKGNDALASHIKVHPQCKCGKVFQATVSKNHKKNCPELNPATLKHDDKVDENPLKIVACHVCKKKCKGKDALATHIKIHSQCKCGKFFQAKVSKTHRKNCPELNSVSAQDQAASDEPKQPSSQSMNTEERNKLTFDDHNMKMETLWSYPDPVESHGAVTDQSYGRNIVTNQQSDQTLAQNVQNDITDGNCDTNQGVRRNVTDSSLSVACHVCNKKCKGKNALASHIKIHTQCKCGKFFLAKVSKTHRKNCPELNSASAQDQAASDDISCCQACGKKCTNKEQLMKHVRDVGHVQCPFCTRLLNGPKSTTHIKKCNEIINEEWKQT